MRFALVVTAVLWAQPAMAFVCTRIPGNGPSVFWESRTVPYVLHERCSADVETDACLSVLRTSFTAWTDVNCSDFNFVDNGITSDARTGYDWRRPEDAVNSVVFREGDPEDPLDGWTHQRGALAITTVTFNSRTGKILDADVEVNGVPNGTREYIFQDCGEELCTENDIQNTMTHEAGHVLGLDHPPATDFSSVEATMYGSAPSGETKKRTLDQDDVNGLCSIYPSGLETAPCFPASPTAASPVRFRQLRQCDDTSSSPCGGCQGPQLGLMAGMFLLLRRRRS